MVGLETDWTGGEFAFFPLGETYLALNQPPSFEPQVSDTEVVLGVDDVMAVYAEMKDRGVPFEVEPRPVTNDGTRSLLSAYFRDPDGPGFVVVADVAAGLGYAHDDEAETVTTNFEAAIPNIPGKSLIALEVEYAPGATSPSHTHAKSAFIYAYVTSGLFEAHKLVFSVQMALRIAKAEGQLNAREADVLQLQAEGLTNEDIADRLGIGQKAVQMHMTSIYSKLGVSSREEAIEAAAERGIIVIGG